MKVGCVIVNFRSDKDTLSIVANLQSCQLPKNAELILYIVDNDNSKDLRSKLANKKNIRYLPSEKNLGFAAGNNVGIKLAIKEKVDIVVLLNNDTIVKKDFIESILSSDITKDSVGAVGGLIYFAKGFEYEKGYKQSDIGKVVWYGGGTIDWDNVYVGHKSVNEVDNGQFQKTDTPFITGCLMVLKSSVLKQSGLFDERYCLYLEDSDLCERIKSLGYKLIFDPSIKMWHKVAQGSGIGSPLNDYFITRNRLLFGFTYARSRTRLALLREALRMFFTGTPAQKMAIRDFVTKNYGWGSWKNK